MIQQVQDVSVLGLEGEIDKTAGDDLCRRIEALVRFEWNRIVLDLGQVEHIHYTLAPRLAAMAKNLSSVSGGVKLANLNSQVKAILQFVSGDVFETYDSVAEAVLSFDREDSPTGWVH